MTLKLVEKLVSFHDNADGLLVKHEQEIPQAYLDQLQAERNESMNRPMGDLVRVASIPTALYDELIRAGYDIENEPIERTMALLRANDLHKFTTTDRRF